MQEPESDAIKTLSDGLKKFKKVYKEKGWEDDELHQKITEAYEGMTRRFSVKYKTFDFTLDLQ